MSYNSHQSRKAGRPSQKRGRPASDASTKRLSWLLVIAVVALIAYLIAHARQPQPAQPINPAGDLTAVVTNPNLPEQIIHYRGMTVSFNPTQHIPNWVAWELLGTETTGASTRDDAQFAPDPAVDGCPTPADYRHSGYDRGHMAPAGDMKWHPQALAESFLMTNICPQVGELNRGTWSKIEDKCRQRANLDSAVVVICGPVFTPGEHLLTIGDSHVAVPRRFFKVVLSPYSNPPQAIGFILPNGPTPGGMQAHAVSVDSIEALTGHNFFSALPPTLEQTLESRADFHRWSNTRRPRRH